MSSKMSRVSREDLGPGCVVHLKLEFPLCSEKQIVGADN